MISTTKRIIFLILVCVFSYSCSDNSFEKKSETYILKYNNGQKYCEGNFIIYSNEKKSIRKRDGIWKYYELDGKPMRIEEYDLNDLVSYKEFNENGKVAMSQVWSPTSHNLTYYYFNGNIK